MTKQEGTQRVLTRRRKKDRGGFTLIEVVCVIVILGALMAILMPVFSQARERALISRSTSNMSQLHQASLLYATDYGHDPRLIVEVASNMVDVKRVYNLPNDLFHTQGRPTLANDPRSDVYCYTPVHADGRELEFVQWQEHVTKSGQNPVLLIDSTFDTDDDGTSRYFRTHRAFAVFYDGHAATRMAHGEPTSLSYWE